MLRNLREKAQSESGFTLIELLVVVLILGILAAVAVPSFLNQRQKGQDAEAKSYARTAQTAAETIATEQNGSYATVTEANMETIEPTLTNATFGTISSTATTYSIAVTSDSGGTFTLARAANGGITRTCSGGACSGGSW